MTDSPTDKRTKGQIDDSGPGRVPGGGTTERPIYIPVEGETSAGATQDEQAAPEQ